MWLLYGGFYCTKDNPSVTPPAEPVPVVGTAFFSKGPFTLVFSNNDPGLDTTTRSKLVQAFFAVYPEETKRFNANSIDTVFFSMDTAYSGVAATSGGTVVFSSQYYRANPKDIDVLTHELMHIVQNYPRYDPPWLVEGIADYARYRYGLNNEQTGWFLPDYTSNQHYTDGYRVTARFLLWLEVHKSKTIVDQLDKSLRNQTYYSEDIWKKITGETIDQLWKAYAQHPSLL